MNTWARSAIIGVAVIIGALTYQMIRQPAEEPTLKQAPMSTTQPAPAQAPTTQAPTTQAPATPASAPAALAVRETPPAIFAESLDWLAGDELASQLEVSATVWVDGIGMAWSHNPHLELFPASNQKLFTAAAALYLLPAEHTFSTTVLAADGNLHLLAGGDPNLTRAGLTTLATSTAAAGLGRIEGDLIVDVSRFSPDRMAPGWQDWQMPTYVGPLSTLTLDGNRWTKNEDFLSNPDIANAEVFLRALSIAGVEVAGEVRLGAAPSSAVEVARVRSAPVNELVSQMMSESNNVIAEALLREIGAVNDGHGSTEVGGEAAHRSLRNAGVGLGGNTGDGSGLSRANLHSSHDWVEFLNAASGAEWFGEFRDSLPVAGVDGTLANRLVGKATKGNVRAKTGTIIGGRALSGYLTLASGEAAAFSIVINGERSDEALALIDRWVTVVAKIAVSD